VPPLRARREGQHWLAPALGGDAASSRCLHLVLPDGDEPFAVRHGLERVRELGALACRDCHAARLTNIKTGSLQG